MSDLWTIEHAAHHNVVLNAEDEIGAVYEYCRLTGHSRDDITVLPAHCCADCDEFATETLDFFPLVSDVPKEWFYLARYQLEPGEAISRRSMSLLLVCAKHARRLRRNMNERLMRIEKRLDELEWR